MRLWLAWGQGGGGERAKGGYQCKRNLRGLHGTYRRLILLELTVVKTGGRGSVF